MIGWLVCLGGFVVVMWVLGLGFKSRAGKEERRKAKDEVG